MPTFGDWDMLPQLHAFMLEALRWRPPAPLGMFLLELERHMSLIYACIQGFPHRAMKDIIWVCTLVLLPDLLAAVLMIIMLQRGQCIPAGATVIGSHWYVLHVVQCTHL